MSNTFMSNTSRRAASLLNAALVVAVVGWNYWTARHGLFGNDVRGMSEAYDTQFTPASYAFSIWGLIFLLQGVHAVHQLRLAFGSKPTRFFDELGPWLLLANALNIVWTVAWLGEWTGTSVVILAAINLCLVMALRRTRMGRSKAPVRVVVLEWLPLGVYAGWVAVAVIANLSAWLAKEGWVPGNSSAW
ncbi:MAG: tryptophan-rich sensory protein, partial [Myxococcota bacterium]